MALRSERPRAHVIFTPHRADLLALGGYILFAVLLTYPLVLHFTTHVAGDGSDDPALTWNLWWVPYSILHLGASPIYTDYMFYPVGLNLAFYTLTYLNAFLAVPIQFAFNLVVAANVNLLFSFALSGFGTYLLAKYLLRRASEDRPATAGSLGFVRLASFTAGALYAFSSNKLLYASLGQFNIASSQWIPFYVLFLLKTTDVRRSKTNTASVVRYGALTGLFLLLQALSEFIFASFLIIFTAVYSAYWLAANRRRLASLRPQVSSLVVAAVVFVVPMLPILSAMLQDTLAEGDFIQSGLGFANVFSTDLLGFFVPSSLHPLFRGLAAQFHFAYTNFAYLGLAALLLAVLAVWKVPRARPWAVLGALFALISLGPDLRVNGAAVSAPFLPFDLLLDIPFVKGNRYPSRWSVMVTLALAVMLAYGLTWAGRRLQATSQRGATVFVSGVLLLTLFEHLSVPLPLSNFQIPEIYQTIARDPGDFAVLEIPLAWRNGYRMTGTIDQEMMFEQWYQTEHEHPILGGNTSRNPEFKFQYFTEAPVLNSLIAVETGHTLDAATLKRDQALAPAVLHFFGIRYVVWHSPRDSQNLAALRSARAYAESVFPMTEISAVVDDSGETAAYRVNDEIAEAESVRIRPDDPLARLNFAEGWGAVGQPLAWATRRQARLFVRLDSIADETVGLRMSAPTPNQRMELVVNGTSVATLALRVGDGNYTVEAPREAWRPGMNEIDFQFAELTPVGSVRAGDYVIGTTGVSAPVSLVVRSAGSEIGDFAHVYVDGVDAAADARGYDVVIVDPRTGAVGGSEAFDTFASPTESARLAQYVGGIQNGKIVAVAARDSVERPDVPGYLSAAAVDALRSIGGDLDLRGKFRWSHAIIGVKGAAPGTALEAASETWPSQLVVGVGATEPNVAVALESFSVPPR